MPSWANISPLPRVSRSPATTWGEALQPVHTATTVRVRNGKTSTTDGPFAETKEQLGGFYMIEARDLNDAIQIAARIPSAKSAASKCGRSRTSVNSNHEHDDAMSAMKYEQMRS